MPPVTIGQFRLEDVPHYSPLNAYWLAQCAIVAYLTPELVEKQLLLWGFEHVDTIGYRLKDVTTEYYFARHKDFAVLAYRGTNNSRDWLSSLEYDQRPFLGIGRAHRGWSREAGRASGCVATKGLPLFVCGHSKGAAQASLEAAYRAVHKMQPSQVYAFATPRVFNAQAAKNYNWLCPRTYRLVHNNDLFTRLPFVRHGLTAKVEYRHCGELVYFNRRCRRVPAASLCYRVFDRALGRLSGGVFDGLNDHDKWRYLHCAANDLMREVTA